MHCGGQIPLVDRMYLRMLSGPELPTAHPTIIQTGKSFATVCAPIYLIHHKVSAQDCSLYNSSNDVHSATFLDIDRQLAYSWPTNPLLFKLDHWLSLTLSLC